MAAIKFYAMGLGAVLAAAGSASAADVELREADRPGRRRGYRSGSRPRGCTYRPPPRGVEGGVT